MEKKAPKKVSKDVWCPFCTTIGEKTLYRCEKQGHDWANENWWRLHCEDESPPQKVTTEEIAQHIE